MPDIDHSNRLTLIQGLLLEAGRLTEDASPDLALALADDEEPIDCRIASVEAVADDLSSLAGAARILFQMGNRPD